MSTTIQEAGEIPNLIDKRDRFIKIGIDRIEETSIKDSSDEYQLENGEPLNPENYLTMSSPLEGFGEEGKRSRTEGRARSFFQRIRELNTGKIWNDVLVKGIGGKVQELTRKVGDSRETVVPTKVNSGRTIPVRYAKGNFSQITGKDYGSGLISSSNHDDETSKELASKGLRTRQRFFAGKLKGDTKIATDEGFKRVDETFDDPKEYPSIEMWLMRCSYRLKDVSSFIAEKTGGILAKSANNLRNMHYNFEVGRFEEKDLNTTKKDYTKEFKDDKETKAYFRELRNIIQTRAIVDEDERFRAVGDITGDISDQVFFQHYLQTFATMLGEQVGIMYELGAFSTENMFNSQNISLLAEIVDHDVTFLIPKYKEDPIEVFKQVNYTYNALMDFINFFHMSGMIPEDFDVVNLLKSYSIGIKSKLSERGELENFKRVLGARDTKDEVTDRAKYLMGRIEELEQSNKELEEVLNNPQKYLDFEFKRAESGLKTDGEMLKTDKRLLAKELLKIKSPIDGEWVDKRSIFSLWAAAPYNLLRLLLD